MPCGENTIIMHRFFVQEPCRVGCESVLLPEEARHAEQVLRLTPGEAVELLDGQGLYAATLTRVDKRGVRAQVSERLPDREPGTRVTLFQGLAKGDKMDAIVQKCTELGVHAVQPLEMARCVQRMDPKRMEAQIDRWQRIAREAAKQCGRALTPPVYRPFPLGAPALAERWTEQDLVVVLWEEAELGGLRSVLDCAEPVGKTTRIGLVIGPEGGITEGEIAQLHAMGAKIATLGPRVLRTETAGIAVLAAVLAMRGELE